MKRGIKKIQIPSKNRRVKTHTRSKFTNTDSEKSELKGEVSIQVVSTIVTPVLPKEAGCFEWAVEQETDLPATWQKQKNWIVLESYVHPFH